MLLKNIKYIVGIILIMITSLIIYWYYNPSINNQDFHLEYQVANSNENFYDARNTNINEEKYSYNNKIYFNEKNKYKITIHSLDITNKGERIIIVTDFLDGKTDKRIANITYKGKLGVFSPLIIKQSKDSVYIIQILESLSSNNTIFEGKKLQVNKK